MKNTRRALCLIACGIVSGVAAAATVFQGAPGETPPPLSPAPPLLLPPRELPPPTAPAPQETSEANAPAVERHVYGQAWYARFADRPGGLGRIKIRERGLVRSYFTDPRPIPPLQMRYAVISLYAAQQTRRNGTDARYAEAYLIWRDMLNHPADTMLDADAQEVLTELRRRYPHARFRLNFTGQVTPAPDGSWREDRVDMGANRSYITLEHEGAIFDAGLLPTGEMAVQANIGTTLSSPPAPGSRGASSAGGRTYPTQVLGKTYAVWGPGPVGRHLPVTHLFLVCFVPDSSQQEQPRVPEAVYCSADQVPWVPPPCCRGLETDQQGRKKSCFRRCRTPVPLTRRSTE